MSGSTLNVNLLLLSRKSGMIKDHVITIVITIIPFPIGRLSIKPMEKSFTSIAINLSSVFAHTSSGSQQSIENSINFVV